MKPKKMDEDEEENEISRVNEGREVTLAKTYSQVIQLLVGIAELIILVMIITTWIFEYGNTPTAVLISLFHSPILFAWIFSLFVIPLSYRAWSSRTQRLALSWKEDTHRLYNHTIRDSGILIGRCDMESGHISKTLQCGIPFGRL